MTVNRRFKLVRRPVGLPQAADFSLDEEAVPVPAEGEFVIRNRYASLDPAMRGWLDDRPSYMPPVALGDPLRASTIGEVVASANPDYKSGDWVLGMNGIEEYSLVRPGGFASKIDPNALPSVTHYLSVLGGPGLTAYFGLLEVGKPKPGETVLVTGAAGAVGSLVGQVARIKGCRVIGVAGGADKCARLTRDYSFDAAIDYRGKSEAQIAAAIGAVAPGGVDVIFENVGGTILDAGLMNLNRGARIALCGIISEYNAADAVGARNIWQLIVKSASISGFLVPDFRDRFGEAASAMAGWLAEGKLRVDEHVDEGIENALPAFLRLFEGTNQGKMILKIG